MQYVEYRNASLKHIHTCNYLIEKLKKEENLLLAKKKQIINNIYYLAGYAIESIISYGIYDYIEFDPIESIRELKQNSVFASTYSVSFQHGKDTFGNDIKFCIMKHNFQENKDFFSFHNISDISDIPFIGHIPDDEKLKELFFNWDPELRYTAQILKIDNRTGSVLKQIDVRNLLLSDIEKFVNIALAIYVGVVNKIIKS